MRWKNSTTRIAVALISIAAAAGAFGDPVAFNQQVIDGRHVTAYVVPENSTDNIIYTRYIIDQLERVQRDIDIGGIDDWSDGVPVFTFPNGSSQAGVDAATSSLGTRVQTRVYSGATGNPISELVAEKADGSDAATLSLDRPNQLTIDARITIGVDNLINVLSLHITPGSFLYELLDRSYHFIDDTGTGVSLDPLDEVSVGTFSAFTQQPGGFIKQFGPDSTSGVIAWGQQTSSAATTFARSVTMDPAGNLDLSAPDFATPQGGNPIIAMGGHTVAICDADSSFQQGQVTICSYNAAGVNLGAGVVIPLDHGDSESYPGLAIDRAPNYGSDIDTYLVAWDRHDDTPDDPSVNPGDHSLLETQWCQQFNEFGRAISGRCTIADTSRHEFTGQTLDCDEGSGNVIFGATGFDYGGGGIDAVTSTFNIYNDILAELDDTPTLVVLSEACPSPITDATQVFDNTQITGDCTVSIEEMPGQSGNYGFRCDWTGDAAFSFELTALTDGEKALFDPATHDIFIAFNIQFDQSAIDEDAKVRITIDPGNPDFSGTYSYTVAAADLQAQLSTAMIIIDEEAQQAIAYNDTGVPAYGITWEFLAEDDPTVWIDNLSIWIEPVPEPAVGLLLILSLPLLHRRSR